MSYSSGGYESKPSCCPGHVHSAGSGRTPTLPFPVPSGAQHSLASPGLQLHRSHLCLCLCTATFSCVHLCALLHKDAHQSLDFGPTLLQHNLILTHHFYKDYFPTKSHSEVLGGHEVLGARHNPTQNSVMKSTQKTISHRSLLENAWRQTFFFCKLVK